MKKLIIVIILIVLNFIVYYYLTENIGINTTYEEISTLLIITIITIPFVSLLPAYQKYATKLKFQNLYVPFKKIYLNFYLNISLLFYATMILIALLTYFKVK